MATGLYLIDITDVDADAVKIEGGVLSIERVLTDKSGSAHMLFCSSDMHNGYGGGACGLVDVRVASTTRLEHTGHEVYGFWVPGLVKWIAEEVYFSEELEGGCPKGKKVKGFKYVIADVNGDGYDDIVVTTTEKNCDTQATRTTKTIFLATEHGFIEAPKAP